MKKLLSKVMSFTLALTLLIGVAQPFAAIKSSALTGDELIPYLTYSLTWIQHTADDYDYYINITDCDTSVSGDIVIPSEIDGYPVGKIDQFAFNKCTGITEITLPSTVYSIAENNPFRDCTSLENILVEEGNTHYCSVNGVLFTYNKGRVVSYPTAKTDETFTVDSETWCINDYAFYNCLVKNVVLTDSIKSIGHYAFDGCKNLTSITMPKSNCEIGIFAFAYCEKLESIVLPDGLTTINQSLFSGCNSLKSVNIPDTVTKIRLRAFNCCYALDSIDLPDGLEEIGESAFSSCQSIKSVSIPDSVTSIGIGAFYSCLKLESIHYPSALTYIPNDCFHYCNLTNFEISDSVVTIGNYAFSGNKMTSLVIPESVKTIGN
ncbi:MAG: leucine-rich repeat domain-containing protein, partial [Acutalibacteraceae bacterium]